ncbi:hypothetical protein MBOL_07040 [Mycobacteroides abscessus subsp. bolletii BD]|nr:hypothetical protein MBOL_07040 [Mycobacteroides abscessus subsp. bolletii BD]
MNVTMAGMRPDSTNGLQSSSAKLRQVAERDLRDHFRDDPPG